MSVRKIAGLAAAFSLAVGLIGAGVSAQFTGQVSAQENLNVGTFGCVITDHSAGTLSADSSSLYYDAGTIGSSTAGSLPMNFTVKSTGTIAVVLNIMATPLPAPFVDLLGAQVPVTLTTGGSHTYSAGISWPELNDSNLGQSASIAYVVNCNEVGVQPATVAFNAVGGGPGSGSMTDTITGAGFLPSAPLSVLMYRFGSSTPFDLAANGYGATTGSAGTFTDSFGDDCSPTPTWGNPLHVDAPVIVWASDGTRSAIGTGIIPCSKY